MKKRPKPKRREPVKPKPPPAHSPHVFQQGANTEVHVPPIERMTMEVAVMLHRIKQRTEIPGALDAMTCLDICNLAKRALNCIEGQALQN